MTDHTPEPWKAHPFMSPAKGNPITRWLLTHDGRERGEVYAFGPDYGEATAARIVACVNACAGISQADLELPATNERLRALVKACAGIPTEQLGDVKALVDALDCLLGYHKKAQAQTQLGRGSQQAVSKAEVALATFRED